MNRLDMEFWNGVLKGLQLAMDEISRIEIDLICKTAATDALLLMKANTEKVHINDLRQAIEEASTLGH